MIILSASDLCLSFGTDIILDRISLGVGENDKIGIVGVNGAGKSMFLKMLAGRISPTSGEVFTTSGKTVGFLEQDTGLVSDKTIYDEMLGAFPALVEAERHLGDLVEKLNDSSLGAEEHMALAARYTAAEERFKRDGGYEYKSRIVSMLDAMGFDRQKQEMRVDEFSGGQKTRLALARRLLSEPDVLILDEPTNHLDIDAITWLEDFLSEYFGTVIVVSHDRHFLNNVCTHIVDIDYTQIKMYVGNYEFWYESSQMMQRMIRQQNKKTEEKIKELKTFIERFSANKSKSRQATSRRKLLDNLTVEQLPASSRRYPFIGFDMDRELGKEVLQVNGISKTVDGVKLLNNVSFTLSRTDKVAFIGESEQAITMLFKILMEEEQPDEGTFKWGVSTSTSYFPVDNSVYFNDCDLSILDWIRQYSKTDETETYLRGFLGRMLFSGDDIYKPVKVLSGGEKVRCMFSRMMLYHSNVLLLDRPTNHLDLESITAVNNGLTAFKGVVILSSHDHEILQTVANRIIEITPDGCLDRQGTYEEFLDWKKENQK